MPSGEGGRLKWEGGRGRMGKCEGGEAGRRGGEEVGRTERWGEREEEVEKMECA